MAFKSIYDKPFLTKSNLFRPLLDALNTRRKAPSTPSF
ncbi:hypothetical protein SM11_chr1398 [Sinorhizobium meliloti SM11]|uniref:Uncharacterized protein n=1 Tax=Sinorhizobium meliloti (strain SM11) TaxID=707241 RepID=F7X622_SINMM|nr:hypothetical protein SM11_chr1398 [Sinorhizobium meliloti SM11]